MLRDINSVDEKGNTPLLLSTKYKSIEVSKLLLQSTACNSLVCDNKHIYPLFQSLNNEHFVVTYLILQSQLSYVQANPTAMKYIKEIERYQDHKGNTFFHTLLLKYDKNQSLCEKIVTLALQTYHFPLNNYNTQGFTPLLWAAYNH